MRKERDRQIAAKKLTGDKMYVSPVIDSYWTPWKFLSLHPQFLWI